MGYIGENRLKELLQKIKDTFATQASISDKQDKLVAGSNITIAEDGKTISASIGTTVSVTQTLTDGVEIGSITIGENSTKLYAPIQGTDFTLEVVDALPDTGENGVFYLIPATTTGTNNLYNEYVWIENSSKFELVGSTEIDLSQYAKKDDVPTVTDTYSATSTDAMSGIAVASAVSGIKTSISSESGNAITEKTDGIYVPTVIPGSTVSAAQALTSGTEVGSVTIDGTETKFYAPSSTDSTWENVSNKPFKSLDTDDFSVDESGILSVVWGGGSGSEVSVTQTLTSGTEIGSVTVDGNETKLYAPTENETSEVSFSTEGSSDQAIRFGIDANGNYGYYKVGADTVTPFKTGSGGGAISGIELVALHKTSNKATVTVAYTATEDCWLYTFLCCGGTNSSSYNVTTTSYVATISENGGETIQEIIDSKSPETIYSSSSSGVYHMYAGGTLTVTGHGNASGYATNTAAIYKMTLQ